MTDRFAPPDYTQVVKGEVTNLAFQDDEVLNHKSTGQQNGVQRTPALHDLQRRTSSEVIDGTVNTRDHAMAGPNTTQPACNGFHDLKIPSEEVGDSVHNRPSTDANFKSSFGDMNDNTVKALTSRKLPGPLAEGIGVGSVKRKPSSQTSQGTDRTYKSSGSTRNDSNSVSSPGIQSPYTESVCLQMFDDSFDSSLFSSRGSGSELDSSVMTCVNLGDITEDSKVTDTDSVLTDDVFSMATDGECQLDKSVLNKIIKSKGQDIPSHSGSSSGKDVLSTSQPKSVLPVKHSEKFTKVPVVEKDNVVALVKTDKGEKKQLLPKAEGGTGEGQAVSCMVTKDERSKADIGEESDTLIRHQDDQGHDITDVRQDSSLRESTDTHSESNLKSKSSFHITHPREYDKQHDNSRTLVLQSDDVIVCQFLDNDYDAYKQRRARLSVYSREPSFTPPRSKDYVLLSCLVMFCCNPLFGIIAFSFSVAVNSTYEAGQYDHSASFSKWSLRMSAVGIAVTCFVVLILMIIYWPDNYRKAIES